METKFQHFKDFDSSLTHDIVILLHFHSYSISMPVYQTHSYRIKELGIVSQFRVWGKHNTVRAKWEGLLGISILQVGIGSS